MQVRHLLPLLAALAAAPNALAQSANRAEDDEIVVTSDRQRGGVQSDAPPEASLNAADVRSFGATSIFQLLSAIAPQTGSASIRGSGQPVILVNGRRITGPQEIRDLSPDVISRVDVFDEQLALQYGYSAEQRVVNLVLERRYRAGQAEIEGGSAAEGDRRQGRLSGGYAEINDGNRVAFNATGENASKITESERGVLPPTSGIDQRGSRTVAPDTQSRRASAIFARALDERVTGNASVRVEQQDQRALLGFDSAAALRVRDTTTDTLRATTGLDGSFAGWQYTANLTGDQTRTETTTTGVVAPARATSDQHVYEAVGTLGGTLFQVPAGRVRASFRIGAERREISSESRTGSAIARADLERTTPSGRVTVLVPVTSRRREFGAAFGDISLNLTASAAEPSDFATLSSLGYGASWAPTKALRFTVQAESSDAAPTLQQLGDPVIATPDVQFFDPVRGETVRVTRITGGARALLSEQREDLTINATYSPPKIQGLTLQASWARNNSSDVATALPTLLPETTAAFPGRFVRNAAGVLTSVDARPISLAERNIDSVRIGFSMSRSIGKAPQRPAAAAARPAASAAREVLAEADRAAPADGVDAARSAAPTSAPSARPSSGGGERAAPRASAGRWNVSVYRRMRLQDEAILAPGLRPIDLTDRGGLDGSGGTDGVEFEGGLFYRGLGLRFNGSWTEAFDVPTATSGQLSFSDRFTIGGRAFVNFDARPNVVKAAPFLRRSRLSLNVENLTNSFVEVRDQTGATPAAYQEAYQNPTGRTVTMSFRKQF
ncbi:MAG: TonB-dependent receptor [Caulobacterales bacterium]